MEESRHPPRNELFTRFVEAGRLALVEFGPETGELCFVVDIINHNRVLVDGVGITRVARQSMPLKRLMMTEFCLKISRGDTAKSYRKKLEEDDVIGRFHATDFGKKKALLKARRQMTDFDRFRYLYVRHLRKKFVNEKMRDLKKAREAENTVMTAA